jgi:hypothetical protein
VKNIARFFKLKIIYITKVVKGAALHIEGKFRKSRKKGPKKVPTRVGRMSRFFVGKFFGIFKNGQKKCPKTKREKKFPKKPGLETIIEF